MANNKKIQCSIHLPRDMVIALKHRAGVNQRTFSGEIERIITKTFEREAENQKRALLMAAQGTMNPVEPQSSE